MLHLFCNSQNPTVREETASLLAKMITDKLVGPKVCIALSKFLPLIFIDAMRDNSEASVHMFESEFVASCHVTGKSLEALSLLLPLFLSLSLLSFPPANSVLLSEKMNVIS